MKKAYDEKQIFIVGLIIGILLGSIGFYFISNRYDIKSQGPLGINVVRIDKWSGKTWDLQYVGGVKYWVEVVDR
ncbi:MAG: hypothetical protein WC899_03920 [bacterium]|jgi:hypothetical protein